MLTYLIPSHYVEFGGVVVRDPGDDKRCVVVRPQRWEGSEAVSAFLFRSAGGGRWGGGEEERTGSRGGGGVG